MANVIDKEAVTIAPARHVKVVGGSPVVVPERPVEEEIARATIVGETKGVADDEEAERLPDERHSGGIFRSDEERAGLA